MINLRRYLIRPFLIACALLNLCATGYAESLRIGFTGPFSGPNAFLGNSVSHGLRLGVQHINSANMLDYDLSLIALNDGYNPERTTKILHRLIKELNVQALVGSVGTPTTVAALPILEQYHVPLIAPITGANILRSERAKRHIFSFRTTYNEESHYLVKALIHDLNIRGDEIAILAQKDAYGDAGIHGLMDALEHYGVERTDKVLQIRYLRNHTSAAHAAADIVSSFPTPKVVFLVSTSTTSAQLIRNLDDIGISPLFAALSFSGLQSLAELTQSTQATILISQVTPPLTETYLPMIEEFLTDYQAFSQDTTSPTTLELEGYISARFLGHVLKTFHPKAPPTGNELIASLKLLDTFDLGLGSVLSLSKSRLVHAPKIWLSAVMGGEVSNFSSNQQNDSPALETPRPLGVQHE